MISIDLSRKFILILVLFCYPVADPGGPRLRAPPAPVRTSQKKDGPHCGLQVSRVIAPPPRDKFLNPLLLSHWTSECCVWTFPTMKDLTMSLILTILMSGANWRLDSYKKF